MKNIELTKEHKVKLLEMCTVLFTKYDFSDNCNGELYGSGDCIHFTGGEETFNEEYDEFEIDECIHWFEFCHCYLVNLLFADSKDKLQFYIDTFASNPIDYLYKQFIKLNNI